MDTKNVHDVNLLLFKDFESFDSQVHLEQQVTLNRGYDYTRNGMLKKMTSRYLWRNTKFSSFLESLDKILIAMVNRVKYIQFFNNYGIDRKYINDINI